MGMRAGRGGGGLKDSDLRLGISYSSKELKDPDQLYTTLKNLLAQIKVGGQVLFKGSLKWVAVLGWASWQALRACPQLSSSL